MTRIPQGLNRSPGLFRPFRAAFYASLRLCLYMARPFPRIFTPQPGTPLPSSGGACRAVRLWGLRFTRLSP